VRESTEWAEAISAGLEKILAANRQACVFKKGLFLPDSSTLMFFLKWRISNVEPKNSVGARGTPFTFLHLYDDSG
jgi:hypothetical protein